MSVLGFDHIVLSARDVPKTLGFYSDVLGMEVREERPEKWALYFGSSKISVQSAVNLPEIARNTIPGTANFCVYSDQPISDWLEILKLNSIPILAGPGERAGAVGTLLSVYFHDPDGNLVEICNRLPD